MENLGPGVRWSQISPFSLSFTSSMNLGQLLLKMHYVFNDKSYMYLQKIQCRELLYRRRKIKNERSPSHFSYAPKLIILTVLYLYFSRPFSNIYEHTYTPQDTYMYGVVYFVFENYFNLMSFNFFIIILCKILVRFKGNVCKKAQSRSLICVYYHWL